ncbi:HK97 family phage prohead protease [Chengkuizengella marina]|uniref:HK97 family phage prohead protease n=1 Tax=Chengkuizengella marina TaxID=2507566 RepID=A0A6N9Q855_9BACL|nr:HK97 family phage prohead protease [Chengkuizengella marina]NBI31032.1 HK97 family phage prohead protease [Chengkuizengella marina]
MTNKIEHRAAGGFEIRVDDDGKKYIEGYAMKWNQLSKPLGRWYKFREQFQEGAFDDYLNSGQDTKFLVDHDTGKVLGRSNKGTLTLTTDPTGLKYSLEILSTTLANDAYEDVRTGNKEYISVGFQPTKDDWNEADESNIIRTVIKANLPEISLTAWPAYESTSASTRSIEDAYKEYMDSKGPNEEEVRKLEVLKLKNQILLKG